MVEGFAVIEATAVENNSAKASHTLTGRGLPEQVEEGMEVATSNEI